METLALTHTVKTPNKHRGSSLEDFLKEQGMYEEVTAITLKSLLAKKIKAEMQKKRITKIKMAQRMQTSRMQLDRLLDENRFPSFNIQTLCKAASALNKKVSIELVG